VCNTHVPWWRSSAHRASCRLRETPFCPGPGPARPPGL